VHAEEAFHKLVAFDAIGLSFHLAIIVTDNSKYKEVLARRGPAAQSLLNLLQAVSLYTICSLFAVDRTIL
jgi:hypothetical protein